MITRIVAALVLAAGLSVTVPAAPVTAGGPTVSVADMRFTPADIKVALGATVTWSFPDAMAHTATSTQGFWDSGVRSGGATFQLKFNSAGTYPYVCTIHPPMRGSVRVPVVRSGTTLRWAASGGDTYDVQVRKGKGAWKAFRTGTSAVTARFVKEGTWSGGGRPHPRAAPAGGGAARELRTG